MMPSLAPPPIEPNLLHIHYGHASSTGVGAGADAVVLHRIVSSASSLRGDVDNDDDVSCSSMPGMMLGDSGFAGDIIASIVLINRDHDNGNDGNGMRAAKTVTMATVQRMDGVTVASFELPPLYDNHSSPSKPERPMPGAANTPLASSRYWESDYRDQIMCWASFRRAKNTSTKNRYDVTTSISDNTSSGRKMLCVLGNPTTLLVFDALGDTALVSTTSYYTTPNTTSKNYYDIDYGEGGGEGGGMEGPGGHTIPLPFSARSIFPNEGGGLLISRVPSEEDHMAAVHEYFAAPGSGEGYPCNDNHCLGVVGMMEREAKLRKKVEPTSPTGLSLPATPRVLQQHRRDHSRYMHDDDDGNMNYYDYEKDVDNDDDENVSLEGPPMPLRFHEEGGYASTIGSLFADDNDDPSPAMGVNAMISGDGDGVPCLFSLRHPLDEIHPLAVVVTTPNAAISKDVEGEGDDDSGGLGGDSNSKNINNRNVKLFSNVLETLVYVGSPRLFHGAATTTSITKASPICVTYNERMARHTIWSLSRTISPAEALPLWKTTGRGTWRSSSSSFCSENIKPSHRFVGVEDDEGDYMDHHRQQQLNPLGGEVPSRFSYIHPHFTLSKLFVEDDAMFQLPSRPPHPPSPPLYRPHPHPHPPISSVVNADSAAAAAAAAGTNYDDDSDGGSTMKRYQRHVFLATDMLGKGDLVLCVFMPNHYLTAKDENVKQNAADGARDDSSVKTKETPAILRCFSLACCHNQSEVVSIQSVSHLVDLPCLSAQPVQSIPIPQAPFSWRDDGEGWHGSCSRKRTTRFHNSDRDTLAADILIICPQCVATDDLQNDGCDENKDGKNGLTIGLYRAGVVHITDFAIPQSSLDATCKHTFVRLENAVENRVDIRFLLTADDSNVVNGEEGGKGRKQECRHGPTIAILRVSFSLLMQTSSIAETALRAIESSLVHGSCQANNLTATDYSKVLPSQYQPIRHDSFGLEGFPVSLLVIILPILIRADAARLFQQTTSSHDRSKAKMKNSSLKVEDDGWYSLTVVLLSLLGMKGEDGEERTPAATTTQHTEQKETMRHLWSVATWDNLLQTDFHSTFCDGEGQILFGDDLGYLQDAVEQSATTYESDVFGDGCKYDAKLLSSLACAGKLEANAAERGEVGNNDMLVRSYKQLIFDSLHLLHEDSRLVSQSRGSSWTRRLGTLLLHVSGQMNPLMMDYEDHFTRLLGNSRCLSNACNSFSVKLEDKERLSSFVTPPCIMTCLDGLLQVDAGDFAAEDSYGIAEFKFLLESELNGICYFTWMVLRLYTILFDRHSHLSKTMFEGDSGLSQKHRDRATILAMLDEGVYHSYQLHDELPLGVALPLLEVTRRCCLDPPQVNSKGDCWPPAAFDLVGRNDLAEFVSQSMQGSSYLKEADFNDGFPSSDDINSDGLVGLEDFSSMIFPDDNRVREAVRLLRSSRPLFLRVARPVELSDHEYERSKQEKLLLLCRRSIALPLGRGMLTIGTHHVPSAEQLVIPSIVMAGRVPPVNGTLALDMTACPSNFRVWPEFHNGVAAGLRLPHASDDTNAKTITRTWIKFNKPLYVADIAGSNNSQMSPPSYAHGGVLMALGLRGYLSSLTTIDLTDYLTQGTITTTVGIFLGMASNKRGSCDPSVSKMLCLHVPSLLPPSFLPMDLASPVQAAAVAGIGLLYQGSSHRLMTEFLLSEMGRQPAKDQNSNDRESFALVCGLALGMVNLKRGTSTVSGLEDLRIEERLHCYITGAVNGGDFSGRNEGYEGRVGSCNQGDMDWNSRIDEVNSLNTDITASGATLALGLMYMRSQNASVAASLQLPDTHFLLDYKRPDMLALRVISRSLILWNDIKPTPEWIDLQIPSIVKNSINLMKNAAKRAMNIGTTSDVDVMEEQGGAGGDENTKKEVTNFDPQAIRQANTYIISGACLALGLKYAGSASRAAASAIIERALWLLELRDNKDAVTLTQRPDNSTLVSCLCTAAISLAMVMSGTGDLDSFRLFRALRWKCDDGTLYGTHMAFGAAIGLLFLGGGKCTLGSRPEDVAVLITAFYPHFPILSSDNQYHLQALRHLYVLAVHERILEACDVDSNEKACLPIELSLADSNELVQASLPFLIANDSNFAGLRSKSDRYYPIVINMTDWNTCGNLNKLFVKRKAGHLSYLQDPSGLRSLSLQQVGIANRKSLLNSVNLFSDDATLTSFAKFFCSSSFNDEKSFESCCSDIAYECVKEEKSSDILAVHVKIFKLIDAIGGMKVGIEDVLGVKLLSTYVKMREWLTDGPIATASHLINGETLSLLCESFDDTFQINDSMLMSLAKKRRKELFEGGNRHMVSAFIVWTGVPLHHGPEERRLP